MLEMRKGTIETRMTPLQIIIVTCLYFVALLIVIYFTRATARRIVGPLSAEQAVGLFGMGAIFFGNASGLWLVPIVWTPFSSCCSTSGCHHGYANLSRHLAGGRRFGWRAWRWPWHCGDYRPAADTLRFEVPVVDGVRAGDSTDHRRRPGLYRYRRHRHGVMTLVAGPSRADRLRN